HGQGARFPRRPADGVPHLRAGQLRPGAAGGTPPQGTRPHSQPLIQPAAAGMRPGVPRMSTTPSPAFHWLLLQRLGCPGALARRLLQQDPGGDVAAWLDATPPGRVPPAFTEALGEWRRLGFAAPAARQARADLDWMAARGA